MTTEPCIVCQLLLHAKIMSSLNMTHLTHLALFVSAALVASCSGAIEGVINCGSESDVTDTNFGPCTAVPCEAIVGASYITKVEFTPHFSHEKLRLNIQLIQDPEHDDIIDTEIPDSSIEAGRSYTFEYRVVISGAFVNDALMVFHVYGDGPAGQEVLCLGIGLRVVTPR